MVCQSKPCVNEDEGIKNYCGPIFSETISQMCNGCVVGLNSRRTKRDITSRSKLTENECYKLKYYNFKPTLCCYCGCTIREMMNFCGTCFGKPKSPIFENICATREGFLTIGNSMDEVILHEKLSRLVNYPSSSLLPKPEQSTSDNAGDPQIRNLCENRLIRK
uniref:Cysteine-rich DPF motif domain-containing protein 1 n=1 Tax=Romanomermis culicivorax TaxID=13658 RepID=A0A915KDG0_ROMCU